MMAEPPCDNRVTCLGKPSADRLGELVATVVLPTELIRSTNLIEVEGSSSRATLVRRRTCRSAPLKVAEMKL